MRIFPVVFCLFLFPSCVFDSSTEFPRTVTESEARQALDLALSRVGCPYVWAANGPVSFDCSGLVVWSYRQVFGRDGIFSDGSSSTIDVTFDQLFRFNSVVVSFSEALPGDLVFISDGTRISHGGLVVNCSGSSVTFVNASSFFGSVVVDS